MILREDIPSYGLEILCIEISPPKCKPFLIFGWYRPPSDPIESFSKLEKVLSHVDKENKEIILLGDTNCDFSELEPGQEFDNNSKHLSNVYELFSLKQIIKEPTRVTLNTSKIIDHIACTSTQNILKSGVLPISMSDHFMVYCIRKFNGGVEKSHKIIKTRKMKNFNEEEFLAEVASMQWVQMLPDTDDINLLVNSWSNLFSSIIDKHAPIAEMRVSERYCPWINKDLKDLMKSRDKLKKAAVKNKSDILMNCYRQVRNKVNKLNTSLKKQHYANRITACKGNMQDSWKIINELINKRSKSSNINELKDTGSESVVHKKDIPDTMNSYFCSIGKDLAKDIDPVPNPLLSGDYQINNERKVFHFKTIDVKEIRAAVAKIKTTKGSGNDNISSYFLKLAMPLIEDSLAFLFNTSIETSLFPDLWKVARVTPIFKAGDRANKSNYRPISVLPVISRLFEKLIYNQLYQFLNENGLLAPEQSGFRALHSTVSSLLKNTDDWYSGIDLGKLVGIVYVDLKKAFDTVDHEILCSKLKHYGIKYRELQWFQSYLSYRKQFCRVNGACSKTEGINIGVPQGSCLGPLLFLIYINDITQVVQESVLSMYADDTCLCYQSKDLSNLNETINSDLDKLDKWLKGNKLSLNVTKTNSMLITTKNKHRILRRDDQGLNLQIGTTEIGVIEQAKYLGVQIDNSLSWNEQIKNISSKVSKALGILKYAKKYLPQKTLETLYTSIVEPHFRYCCSVWGCAGLTLINQLQKLQNRAARIVTGSGYETPSAQLIQSLGWKNIAQLIDNELRIMVYKSLHDRAPQYLSDLFSRNSQALPCTLRNSKTDMRVPLKTTTTGQKSFSFRGAKSWNSLTATSKLAPSLNIFKDTI